MKKYIIAASLLLVLFVIPVSGYGNDKAITDEVNADVSKLVALMKDSYAEEYEKARGIKIMTDNVDNNVVAVAVFTIESFGLGNNYTQFMAVFTNLSTASPGHPQRLSLLDVKVVGGHGLRAVEFGKINIRKVNIKERKVLITMPSLEYGPEDGMCCPSIKSNIQYSIELAVGGRLVEIKKN